MTQELSDEALVKSYVASGRRDEAIFRELFRRRREDVWRVCYAFFGNPQDAEDFTQQVFFAAYRKLPQYRHEASVRTWLHRIAANTCKNELRRRSRRPEGFEAGMPEDGGVMAVAATAENELVLSRRTDRLALALKRLNADERRVLQLAEFEGLRYAEIASDLGVSEAAVKMRVLRARIALKSAYETLETKGVSK